MRLSMQLSYAGGFKEAAKQVVDLEKAGLDVVWVAEAYTFDAISQMGYLAAITDRVQIGSGIVNVFSRTPTLLGMTAAGIDFVSDGRCILGLGASGPQVVEGFHGVPYEKPLMRIKETIEVVPAGRPPRGDRLPRADDRHPLARRRRHRPRQAAEAHQPSGARRHPDLVGVAHGQRGRRDRRGGRRLAADHVHPRAGAEGVGRRPEAWPREAFGRPPASRHLGRRHARDRRRPRPSRRSATWVARARRSTSEAWALAARTSTTTSRCGTASRQAAKEIQDLYLDGKKDEAAAKVPEEWLEKTSLVGPASYIAERVAAYKEAGVTVLNVNPVGSDPVKTIDQLREIVDDA